MSAPAYFHNDQPITRDAFYAIACDPRRSVAVEACAGAGKTWMLVSRILRALIEPAPGSADGAPLAPHEILAITFTRKAAGEMRQRLNEWLTAFAGMQEAELARELALRGVPGPQAARLAPALKGAHARLLMCPRPVQVRTFHGWFAALLQTAPLKLLQELRLQGGERVLHVGTGSGYMAALLGRQAASVFTIEIDNAIAAFAQANLQRAGAGNVQVLAGDAAQTAPLPQGPFDAIVLSGSVARAPQHLIAQLAPGGRLLAITGDEPVMRATLVQLQGEGVRLTQPWDCDAPRLMNFADTPVFHF